MEYLVRDNVNNTSIRTGALYISMYLQHTGGNQRTRDVITEALTSDFLLDDMFTNKSCTIVAPVCRHIDNTKYIYACEHATA